MVSSDDLFLVSVIFCVWGVMGPSIWFPGEALFVPPNWKLRVLGPYCIVDRPSDHLSVHTIPLYGCM